MIFLEWTKRYLKEVKYRVTETNFDNLVWLINIVPNLVGFSVRNDKIHALFWIIHLTLLTYIYGVGSAVYQFRYAERTDEFVMSTVNVSMMVLIGNISWWWIKKRPILRAVLKGMEESDCVARSSVTLKDKHTKHLRTIKIIIMVFNVSQLLDAFIIYLPHRVDVDNDNSMGMVHCVGLEPVTSTPYKEICKIIITTQELALIICALFYQTMIVFVIAHTAAMFHMLSQEMMALNQYTNLEEHKVYVRKRLPELIRRHILTLEVFKNLKRLYSVAIGVDFGSNAVCISLLFFVSFEEWFKFGPLLIYCFSAFFMYCFLCQSMTNASEDFETAVYSCGWENFDLTEKRLVLIMLLQAQKPVVMLAGDIVPVNMYTFATTLQSMYKFITVVK